MAALTLCGSVLLLACVLHVNSLSQLPPSIVKQPPTEEVLFKVAQLGIENETPFTIECEAEGEPQPRYTWIKNGKNFEWEMYDYRIVRQPERGTLVITSPRDEDVGVYQCFAENEWGIATSNSVFVRKAELNSFKISDRITQTVQEGEPTKLTCTPPDGWPKPKVYWLIQFNEGSLKIINNPRVTVDPEGNLWFSNVTMEDASNDFSYVCAASSPIRNEYKLGNRVSLNVLPSEITGAQKKYEPTQQYVTRRKEVAYRGREVHLYCIYGGTPLPEVVWQKGGVLLENNDRISHQNYGRSILIKNVSYDDIGTYTCEASNDVGTAKSYSISLDVLAIPYFTVEPESVTIAEDEEVEIRCEASGIPEPQIKWIHNGKPIAESPSNSRRSVTSNGIIIKKLIKSDTGNYGCNATNSLGYVYKDFYVNVLDLPPEIIEPPAPEYTTVNGNTETLRCRVFGSPRPLVKWLKGGVELTGGRFSTTAQGDLQIQNINFHDADTYMCHATNKFGETSAVGKLVVKERTRITDKPYDYYETRAGMPVTLQCNAFTDPSLTLSIEWQKEGVPVNYDREPRFVLRNDYSLAFTKTIASDSGIYTCVAKTVLDQDTVNSTLIVKDVPNSPMISKIKCNKKDANIEWKAMGDNRSPIIGFLIESNASFTPDTWNVDYDIVPASDFRYNFNMSPWANYTFRVHAQNKIGTSPLSGQYGVCTTQPDVPYKNPDKVEVKSTEPTNLKISWKPMPEIEHNGPGFHYRVSWKRNITGEEWNVEDVYNWRQSELLIRDQPTFKPYAIKVVALNEKGESQAQPVEIIGYSGEGKPLEAPGNFTLVEVYSSMALLSWNPVSPDSVRGHFKGYKFETWTDRSVETNIIEYNTKAYSNRFVLTDLVPFSKNYVRISIFNGKYDGPPSNTLSFDTPEGVPGTVQAFFAFPVGPSTFYLFWKKPEQPNGILTGYKITHQEVHGTVTGQPMGELVISDPHQTRAKLDGLQSNTKYRLTIVATTQIGRGKEYFIEEETESGSEDNLV